MSNIDAITNERLLTGSSNTVKNDNDLGKDSFLQLLAAQMRYQDPLNPNTDTQFVAQLATFSQLEQMQNLNTTATTVQAFGLVGKTVIMKAEDSSGNTTPVAGKVDFVTMVKSKPHLSINGNLYSADNLDTVLGEEFLDSLGLPQVEKINLNYDLFNPKDVSFKINMGSDENAAENITVKIGDKEVDKSNITIEDGVVTINKDALKELSVGKTKVEITFDDKNKTKYDDMVSITVVDTSKNEGAGDDGKNPDKEKGSGNSGSAE